MHVTTRSPLSARPAVLIVSHPDGHIEAFGEPNVDIHFARVPMSFSRDGEIQAEELMQMTLPPKYQKIYQADRLRKTGTTRPLRPSTIQDSQHVSHLIRKLNEIHGLERQPIAPLTNGTIAGVGVCCEN